jgi:hypothetical protein
VGEGGEGGGGDASRVVRSPKGLVNWTMISAKLSPFRLLLDLACPARSFSAPYRSDDGVQNLGPRRFSGTKLEGSPCM